MQSAQQRSFRHVRLKAKYWAQPYFNKLNLVIGNCNVTVYNLYMIKTFADKETQELFITAKSKRLPLKNRTMTIPNATKREIPPTYPGEMLREDFMPDFNLNATSMANGNTLYVKELFDKSVNLYRCLSTSAGFGADALSADTRG
jgi:hypothetical protein